MKILHITPASIGYEEVTLLANAVNRTNGLAVIEKDGVLYYTGGFLIKDTPEIRKVLDALSPEKQYEFIRDFKSLPFVRFYYEEKGYETLVEEKPIKKSFWSNLFE
jgi:hypothetical protein